MWLEYVKTGISVVFILAGLVSIILSAFSKSKNKKVSNAATNLLKLADQAQVFIANAEKVAGFSGETKKEFVMVKLAEFAIKNGIDYDEKVVDGIVEKLVAFSNKVNCSKPQKEEAPVVEDTEGQVL